MKKIIVFTLKFLLALVFLFIVLIGTTFTVAYMYKKDILAYLNTSLTEKISGDLHFKDIHFSVIHPFPSFSVALEGFTIKDSVYKQDVLRAEDVFLQLRLYPLLQKKLQINSIRVEDAIFSMLKDSSGYSNLTAFRLKHPSPIDSTKPRSDDSSLEFALKNATFKDVTFDFHDEKKNKSINIVGRHLKISFHKEETSYQLQLKGLVHSGGLNFNPVKGPFLFDKDFKLDLALKYDIGAKLMTILSPSTVSCEDQLYAVQGHSDLGQKPPILQLEITCEDTDYDKALALLNPFLRGKLQKFHAKGGIKSHTILQIDTRPGTQPKAWVNFELKDSKARLLSFEFEHVFLKGLFTNCVDTSQAASNENSKVEINGENLSFNGLTCKAQALLSNLSVVHADIKASVNGPLGAINHFLDTSKCNLTAGNLGLELAYKGPLALQKSSNQQLNASINGKLSIEKGQLEMVGKHMQFAKIQSKILFNNQDVKIAQLSTALNGNTIGLKGDIKQALSFLLFPDKECFSELSLYCPYFNINSLVSKNKKKKVIKKTAPKSIKPFMNHLESISEHLTIKLDWAADRIQYHKMNATNVKGLITFDKKALSIDKFQLNLAPNGKIQLDGRYLFEEDRPNHTELNVTLKNIDAARIFQDFDDFNQKTLTHKQLGGKMNGLLSMTCDMNENLLPIQHTLKGYMKLQFLDGSLNNFEPLRKISKIVFRNRDLMHIRMDDLNTRFVFDGYDINIEKLTLNSSAISLFIEGTYSFKHHTDLGIQIPLSNLKARKDEFYHAEQHSHGNIRLRAQDKDGKVNVSFDKFDKFHKDHPIN